MFFSQPTNFTFFSGSLPCEGELCGGSVAAGLNHKRHKLIISPISTAADPLPTVGQVSYVMHS